MRTGLQGLIFLAALVLPVYLFSQDTSVNRFSGTIPEMLLMPMRGEAPRYPQDMVIGSLGQGTAPDAAWRFANDLINALMTQTNDSILTRENNSLLENCRIALATINPLRYHLGEGRTEPDGTVSFLVRFLGREQWIAGELYLRPEGNNWRLDDLVLDESRNLEEGKNAYPYSFSPYERFF